MPAFKQIAAEDMAAYAALTFAVKEDLIQKEHDGFMFFPSVPDLYKAMTEQKIASLWLGKTLVAVATADACNINERLATRFPDAVVTGVSIDEGVYVSNLMVNPEFYGMGFAPLLLSHIAELHDEKAVALTAHHANAPAHKAVAAAGFSVAAHIESMKYDAMLLYTLPPRATQKRAAA